MPSSINGIGTGIVKASKKREVNGHIQYDALQAVVFLLLPIIPYKAIHILSVRNAGAERQEYQSVDLRKSLRLILKGFFNGWGNVLMFAGGCGLPLISYAFATMARKMNSSDYAFLYGTIGVLVAGIVAKSLFWILDARDQRIREIMGLHETGDIGPVRLDR